MCVTQSKYSAAKCEPPLTLAYPLIVIRRGVKRPATGARRRRDRTRPSQRINSNVTNRCARLDANKPQKALRGLDKASVVRDKLWPSFPRN